MQRKYYEAYDDRYRQIHSQNLKWFDESPSAIVLETIHGFGIIKENKLLELGCGEGRDAFPLLQAGFRLLATDISPEAIRYCRGRWPQFADKFQILDCVGGNLEEKFDFIYAVAVIHMLVEDGDRAAFFDFIRDHLKEKGIALICTMGDGVMTVKSDISTAFDLHERTHDASGEKIMLAGTSCRMVTWDAFLKEIRAEGLKVLEKGLTEVLPDFNIMMYAVVEKS
jgi:SAM-dependent methyltransferase